MVGGDTHSTNISGKRSPYAQKGSNAEKSKSGQSEQSQPCNENG